MMEDEAIAAHLSDIEEAFNTVKRLLGLSYLWTGSLNGIKLQLWRTWLFYAVLVDLGDAVADEVSRPLDRISSVSLTGESRKISQSLSVEVITKLNSVEK